MTPTLAFGAFDPPVNPAGYTRVLFVERLEHAFAVETEWVPCVIELPGASEPERSTPQPFRFYTR